MSKIDFVVTEEFEIVALLLLLYRRKAIRKAVLVILLVKNKTTLECISDSIVSYTANELLARHKFLLVKV